MKILYLPNAYSQQRQQEKKVKVYPVLMAMEAEWYRKQGHEVYWDESTCTTFSWDELPYRFKWQHYFDKIIREAEGLPFLDLPHPDRTFTRWWEYQDNGNFKYLPATYIQSARDCWWRPGCTFCKWAKKYPKYEVRKVHDVMDELMECKKMGFKEIFDDSGTFPTGAWLSDFCYCAKYLGLTLGCNMRFGADVNYWEMKDAGFRMVLYGLESANQKTLDRINKGTNIDKAIAELKVASEYIEPHIAVMFGYPWETDEDAQRTLKLVWWLLKKGYAKTAQASFYSPPRTWVNTKDAGWEPHRKYINQVYNIIYHPRFWLTKLQQIKDINDIKYYWRALKLLWKSKTKSTSG